MKHNNPMKMELLNVGKNIEINLTILSCSKCHERAPACFGKKNFIIFFYVHGLCSHAMVETFGE
jgi:hypothetical protein